MKYIKRFNSINEGLSKKSYIYDIEDILQELDMVDIPSEYKQDVKFNIDKKLDEDRILRINIFGSENKQIPLSVVDDIIERLKSYLTLIGCKLGVKYQLYDDGRWVDTKPSQFKKMLIGVRLNLYKTLQATYSDSNYFLLLNDKNTIVLLDKEMPKGNRIYYITFKELDSNSIYSTLKFEYMVNSRDFINFKIHDNHGNLVEWNKLSYFLNTVGVDYGIFNNGFGYMEGDFNNQTYTWSKTKKFFDI
jgi:hypothetical protein